MSEILSRAWVPAGWLAPANNSRAMVMVTQMGEQAVESADEDDPADPDRHDRAGQIDDFT